MNLTDWLALLSVAWYHRILRWLKIELDAYHDWLPGFCACGG